MEDRTARHVLVTGGGRGIGRHVAEAFTAAGDTVTVTGRQPDPLISLVAAGGAAGYLTVDVTEEAEMLRGIRAAAEARGPIDVLIANAGQVESAPFLRADTAQFRRLFDVNVFGVLHAARAVLPDMIARRRGRIIVVASVAGLKGYPYVTAYTAAKHAVVGFVRALALETVRSGVTVNAVCPGYTETDMFEQSVRRIMDKTGRSREEAAGELVKAMPLGRPVAPAEVAAACLYLASEGAAAVTGATLVVAGGEL